MILFPAIDLKDGKWLRLKQGDFKQSTTYNESPLEQAKIFEDSGVEYLHCVDLDGALKGNFENIKSGELRGAPQYMEWYSAFSLMITLIWLYVEILILLTKLAGRNQD